MFVPDLISLLFSFDDPFVRIRQQGLDDGTRQALASFWERLGPRELTWVPADWKTLVDDLSTISAGQRHVAADDAALRQVAAASEELARDHPVSASFVALYVVAIWSGRLGDDLFMQPWSGSHPGWYFYPLALARNLADAGADRTARAVAQTAAGFIESEKMAPFDGRLQSIVRDYQKVLAGVERRHAEAVAELAYALRAACKPEGENARAGVAALFWSHGDAHHAVAVAAGAAPPLSVFRHLVESSIRRLASDPLSQFVWLEMKDRPPLDLRAHTALFTRINAVYATHPLFLLDESSGAMGTPISRAYARVALSHFRGAPDQDAIHQLGMHLSLFGDYMREQLPMASSFIRITGILSLAAPDGAQAVVERWRALAGLASFAHRYAGSHGYALEATDPTWNLPFAYLGLDTPEDIASTLDLIEEHRNANLWYWLAITPPPPPAAATDALLKEEADLLRELRGARFVRLLSSLPSHYNRYGFSFDDALGQPPPEGARPTKSALAYDPFDPELATKELGTTLKALRDLHQRLAEVAPEYAAVRLDPRVSHEAFVRAAQPPSGDPTP